ncbi:RecB family exonuclease, partial [Streptomyces sparsus]
AADERLATLAALRDEEGNVLVPSAHPSRWWGLHEPTRSEVPLRDRDQPVLLSGSALGQLDDTCSLQWFLGREVKADAPATAAQGFGNVLHVLADEVATGATPADLPVLLERLDSVWDALAFEAPWKSRQEKDSARAALERFLRWHVQERGGRRTAASEHAFDVTLPAGEFQVRIRGSVDRVEQDAEGRAYVVDFKTGKAKPTGPQVALNPQLAVYQLAVREGTRPDSAEQSGPGPGGGVSEEARPDSGGSQTPAPSGNAESGAEPAGVESDGVAQAGVELGGAELVHLRLGATAKEGGDAYPAVQRQDALAPAGPDGDWVGDLLTRAAGRVLDERFSPSPGQHCGHCAFRAACSARPEG